MLEEKTVIDDIRVLENGIVEFSQVTKVYKDGVEVASSESYRDLIVPGESHTGRPPRVVAVCIAVHTPEVITEYEKAVAERKAAREAARA